MENFGQLLDWWRQYISHTLDLIIYTFITVHWC